MEDQLSIPGIDRFSAQEVLQGFEQLNPALVEPVRIVMDALMLQRKEQWLSTEWREAVFEMAKAGERQKGDVGRKESILEEVASQAVIILTLANRCEPKNEIDLKARDVAAVLHVHLSYLEASHKIDEALVVASGVNIDWLLASYRKAFEIVENPDHDPSISEEINTGIQKLADLNEDGWGGLSRDWEIIAQPYLDELRTKLLKAGWELPELGHDGLYDEEREDYK